MNTLKLPKRFFQLLFGSTLALLLTLTPWLLQADEKESVSTNASAAIAKPGSGARVTDLYDIALADLTFDSDVLAIRTNGAMEGYRVSRTEFFLRDRLTGENGIETLATPVASAEQMRSFVHDEDGVWGQECQLVLYRDGMPETDEHRRFLTHKIEIQLEPEVATIGRLQELADAAGLEMLDDKLTKRGWAFLRANCGGSAVRAAAMLEAHADVKSARPVLAFPTVKCSLPNDQFFNPTDEYWTHPDYPLVDRIEVWQVWCGLAPLQQRYFGRNVDISVLDDGIQGDHPEIDHAYTFRDDTDFIDEDNDGSPSLDQDNHGTWMAGVIVARHNNGTGLAGIAPAANIFSTRSTIGSSDPDMLVDAHEHEDSTTEIVLLGFVPAGNYVDISEALEDTFERLAERKDIALIYPSGENSAAGSRVDYDRAASHRHTIAVAAFGGDSETGASLIVTGPGEDMVTTDRTGAAGGSDGDFIFNFGGSSAAAACTAGVVALMQDARRELEWRDIQDILLLTAFDWHPTHVNYPEGTGLAGFDTPFGTLFYKHSHQFGAGMVVGHCPATVGAVVMSEVWPLLPSSPGAYKTADVKATPRREDIGMVFVDRDPDTGIAIYENRTSYFLFDFNDVAPRLRGTKIEHAEIRVEWEEPPVGQQFGTLLPATITLICPWYFNEMDRPLAHRSFLATGGNVNTPTEWIYTTVRHWGQTNAPKDDGSSPFGTGGFDRVGFPGGTRGGGTGRPQDLSDVIPAGNWELEITIEPLIVDDDPEHPLSIVTRRLIEAEMTIYGSEDNDPPEVISANISTSGNPGVLSPRTAFVDEDLIISDAMFNDPEGDEIQVRYTWQRLGEDGLTWENVIDPVFGSGLCEFLEAAILTTVADEGLNLDETYFILHEPDGTSVGFWFQSSFFATIPPEAAAADRSVAIRGVLPNEGADGVAADIITAINNDGFFTAALSPGETNQITIEYPEGAVGVDDPDPGNTGFALVHEIKEDPNGNCFGTTSSRLDSSHLDSETKYRAIITPKDRLREGFRFISDQIIVNSRPITTGVFRERYYYDADLWIETVPPEDLDPFGFINELSQGTGLGSGENPQNTEWVEIFINYSVDMRGYRLSNDIASFDLTFTQHPIWEEVRYGKIIVIYNDGDRDSTLPPDTPLEDFNTTDVWIISSANGDLFQLPANGDGWGEFSNINAASCDPDRVPPCDGAHAGLLTQFEARNPIHGVSINGNTRYSADAGLAAAQEMVFFDGTDLLPTSNDPMMPPMSPVNSAAWSRGSAFDATPGAVNSTNNQMIYDQILAEMKTSIPTYRFYPGDGTQGQIDPITGHILMMPDPDNPGEEIPIPDFVASDLVPGLRINEKTGEISGVPNVPMGGTFTIKIQRSHSFSSEIQIFDLTVLEAPPLDDDEDEDGDGTSNLLEEALASNPFDAETNVLPTGQIFVDIDGMSYPSITFRRIKDGILDAVSNVYTVGNLEYTIEGSTDLQSWWSHPDILVVQESAFDDPDDPFGISEIATFRAFDSIESTLLGTEYYLRLSVTRLP